MNCLEFRRAVLADPRRPGREAAVHAAECTACKEFLAHTLAQEQKLAEALRVPVPEGLQARLLHRVAASRRWVGGLALAASLIVAAGIAFLMGAPRSDPLALAGIEFVVYEEAQTIVDAKPTDWNALARVAREMGVSLPDQLGEMRYICVYPVAGQAAHHLLVSTPLGKITLLLVPDRPLDSRVVAAAHGLRAAVVPARKGFVAIIGSSERSIARAESLLRAA